MAEAQRLRARKASLTEVDGAGSILYPTDSSTDKTMRSRLRRACLASDTAFAEALAAYHRGANSSEVLDYMERTSSGAPKGNLNGAGKKRKDSSRKFAGAWRAMSREEQDEFLAAHQLSRRA